MTPAEHLARTVVKMGGIAKVRELRQVIHSMPQKDRAGWMRRCLDRDERESTTVAGDQFVALMLAGLVAMELSYDTVLRRKIGDGKGN